MNLSLWIRTLPSWESRSPDLASEEGVTNGVFGGLLLVLRVESQY